MKVEVEKAEKALGFTHLMRMMGAIFEDRKLHEELKKEFEEYKRLDFLKKER